MSEFSRETLVNVGFLDIAVWHHDGDRIDYTLDGERALSNNIYLDAQNALYAFVRDDLVLYIGKTIRSIRNRLYGYRNPGQSQSTNIRCNRKIKDAIKKNEEIRILVFVPICDFRYLQFPINLAAALEDALILAFDPPWNGRDKGKPISEEQEREEIDEAANDPKIIGATHASSSESAATKKFSKDFTIKLKSTYYNQGLVNPGIIVSSRFGTDGEDVQILFSDRAPPVYSKINRTANPNGSVRIIGNNRQISEWFQRNFKADDVVDAQILDENKILLRAPE